MRLLLFALILPVLTHLRRHTVHQYVLLQCGLQMSMEITVMLPPRRKIFTHQLHELNKLHI